MKSIIFTFIATTIYAVSFAEDQMPKASQDLLEKLSSFSEETRQNAEKRITEKEQQVIKVLETHLQAATKAGNLNGALAIQKAIDNLSNSENKQSDSDTEPDAKTENELEFIGHVWMHKGGSPFTWQFFVDGTGKKIFQGTPRDFTWEITKDEHVAAKTGAGVETFHFGRRDKDCYRITKDGEKGQELEIKERANKSQ